MSERLLPELVETDPPPRFDLWELLVLGVSRSRRWIGFATGIGVLIAFVAAMLTPNTYISESKLFLRIGRREQLSSDAFVGALEPLGEGGPTIQDELHMLRDRAIYRRVAERLGPSEVLRPADPSRYDDENTGLAKRVMHSAQSFLYRLGSVQSEGPGTEEALRSATERLYESTVLLTEPESNVITVLHTSTAPARALGMNEALLDAFIDRHAEQFSIDRYIEDNREKLKRAETRRNEANRAYFELLEQCGFFDFAAERPALIADIEDQENELFTARTARAEKDAQYRALKERIKGIPQFLSTVREREPNPKYMQVRDEIAALEVEVASLGVRVDELGRHVAEKRDELLRMRECEKQHAFLATVRESEEEHYQALLERYSLLEDLASIQKEATNLSVMQRPTYDEDKVGPKRGKMLAMGLLGGLLVGLLIALLREVLDSRLRYPQAIERVLGVRVLDVIPEVEATDGPDPERNAA